MDDDSRIASCIDHTLLAPDATLPDIHKVCEQAKCHGFASVCIHPIWARNARQYLQKSPVRVCTVVGFPLGANTTRIKALEAKQAVSDGAEEVDMVLSIGALKQGQEKLVFQDIFEVVQAARMPVKVIFECALLTDEEKRTACRLSEKAGAAYVKTSTGFGPHGATVQDVALLRSNVSPHIGVKASGGIRTREDALRMLGAGANRIGTTASLAILGLP